MAKKLYISNNEDRKIIEEVIKLFLENYTISDICKKIGEEREFVLNIINNRERIKKYYGKETCEQIKKILKKDNNKEKDKEYEQLMRHILFYVINSLYSYREISEKLYIGNNSLLVQMIDNEEYIIENFGPQLLEKLKEAREIRKRLPQPRKESDIQILKSPDHRKLVKPDVITVSSYEYELIKKVSLFFENGGDIEKIAINSKYRLNEIVASLNDIKLKYLLLEHVYQNLQNLLEIDSILTQNRIKERNEIIKNVVIATYEKNGNIEAIIDKLGYPEPVIRRILNHPYVPIISNSLKINVSEEILYHSELELYDEYEEKKQLILDIADFIIENKASYRDAANKFKISKSTVGEYMKDKLPHISKEKSYEVNKLVAANTSPKSGISKEVKERTLFESDLFMRGYTLTQVAYLINGTYQTTQRDLSKKLPLISEEKAQLVKTKLQYNQSRKNR